MLASADVDVVVLCSTELDRGLLNHLSAQARANGRTLFIDPGLSGIDFKRVHTTAIGYQPLLEMSSASLSGLEAAIKRAFDIVVSGVDRVRYGTGAGRHRPADQARGSRSGALQAAASRARRPCSSRWSSSAPWWSTPMPVWRRSRPTTNAGSAVQDGTGSPDHPHRAVPAGDEPRRAAPVVQRAVGDDEPRRTAAGAAQRGRRVPGGAERPASGAPGHHRVVAGRGAGQSLVRGVPPARSVLRPELVVGDSTCSSFSAPSTTSCSGR